MQTSNGRKREKKREDVRTIDDALGLQSKKTGEHLSQSLTGNERVS